MSTTQFGTDEQVDTEPVDDTLTDYINRFIRNQRAYIQNKVNPRAFIARAEKEFYEEQEEHRQRARERYSAR